MVHKTATAMRMELKRVVVLHETCGKRGEMKRRRGAMRTSSSRGMSERRREGVMRGVMKLIVANLGF